MLNRPTLRATPRAALRLGQTQQQKQRGHQAQKQTQKQTLTQDQQQSLKYLALAGLRLERELARALDENPFLTVTGTHTAHDGEDWIGQLVAPGPETLPAALRAMARDLFWRAEDRAVADHLIDAVAESGLLTAPLADLDLPIAMVHAQRVQAAFLAEGGLLADDLAQCFAAQLKQRGDWADGDAAVLAALPLIADKGAEGAAQEMGVSLEGVLECLQKIRGLTPRPAEALDFEQPRLLPPDLILAADENTGGWRARLNPLTHRTYGLDAEALSGLSPQAQKSVQIAPLIGKARSFVRALAARGKTLTALAAHLANIQDQALRHGPGRIAPYSQRDAAMALNLHPSTISRAVAEKTVETPQGVWPMKAFFSALIDPETQFSGAQLRARMGHLIADEDRSMPLSDAALATAIQAQGPQVARRTITKYRLALNMPSATERRRIYGAQAILSPNRERKSHETDH